MSRFGSSGLPWISCNLSTLAVDRASEIAHYIAQDKPTAAEKWVDTVFSKVEQLKTSPELGRVVPEPLAKIFVCVSLRASVAKKN
jgi:plasmid stabilization system protein ParE